MTSKEHANQLVEKQYKELQEFSPDIDTRIRLTMAVMKTVTLLGNLKTMAEAKLVLKQLNEAMNSAFVLQEEADTRRAATSQN